jgi:hypothetical protein
MFINPLQEHLVPLGSSSKPSYNFFFAVTSFFVKKKKKTCWGKENKTTLVIRYDNARGNS